MPGDPQYNERSLIAQFNGADGGTTFTDDSSFAHTLTRNVSFGECELDTAIKKVGTAALLCTDSSAYVSIAAHTSFDMGAGEFCYELWAYPPSSGNNIILAQGDTGDFTVRIYRTATLWVALLWTEAQSQKTLTSTTAPVATQWAHLALVRDVDTVRWFIDGVEEDTEDFTGLTMNATSTHELRINNGTAFPTTGVGSFDAVRVTKGDAVYRENFTPPTVDFGTFRGMDPDAAQLGLSAQRLYFRTPGSKVPSNRVQVVGAA